MSDQPEEDNSIIVNGDNKTVVVKATNTSHPWNNLPLPRPPRYAYQLTVQNNLNNKTVTATCDNLEELFAFHRQFSVV